MANSRRRLDDSDYCYRRVFPSQIVEDGNTGKRRPSSAALERRAGEETASMYARSLLEKHQISIDRVLEGHEGMAVVGLAVEAIRRIDFDAVEDPDGVDPDHPHPCDPAHSGLVEPELSGKPLKRSLSALAKEANVHIDPGA